MTTILPKCGDVGVTICHLNFLSSHLVPWSLDRAATTHAGNRTNC